MPRRFWSAFTALPREPFLRTVTFDGVARLSAADAGTAATPSRATDNRTTTIFGTARLHLVVSGAYGVSCRARAETALRDVVSRFAPGTEVPSGSPAPRR